MTAPRSRVRSVGFVLVLLLLALQPLDSRLRHRRGRRARHTDHELEADDGDDPAAGFGASPFTATAAGGSQENGAPIVDLAQVVARLPRGDESRAGGGGGSGAGDGRGVGARAGAEAEGGAGAGAGVKDPPGMAGATFPEALPRFSRTQTQTKTQTQTPTTQPARDSATETTDGVTDATADTGRGLADSEPIDLAQAVTHPQHQLPPPSDDTATPRGRTSSRFVSSLGTVTMFIVPWSGTTTGLFTQSPPSSDVPHTRQKNYFGFRSTPTPRCHGVDLFPFCRNLLPSFFPSFTSPSHPPYSGVQHVPMKNPPVAGAGKSKQGSTDVQRSAGKKTSVDSKKGVLTTVSDGVLNVTTRLSTPKAVR